MTDTLIRPRLPTCGDCRFGKTINIGLTECWGLPPTPVVIGVGRNLAGQGEAQIELLRPRLAATTAGCALHEPKTADSLGSEIMMGKV